MYQSMHKTLDELIDVFETRGLVFTDKAKAKNKLKFINYYKLKELAYPFSKIEDGEIQYDSLAFEQLIERYYADKNLRFPLLQCIEKIEIAFKTRFAYYLGELFGAYGYYKFNNWCNKEEYCKHYLREKQSQFKDKIRENNYIYKSMAIKEHFRKIDMKFQYDKIPIWLYVDFATFGEVLYMYNLMSKKLREKIANDFCCTPKELESWLGAVKFVRNQIAHNASIIDLQFRTKPKLKPEWKTYVICNETNESVSGLADALVIIVSLTIIINKSYQFNHLQKSINKLSANDKEAKQLGFMSKDSSLHFIKELGGYYKSRK